MPRRSCTPTRTLIVASAFTTCELRKSAGKGVGAACADRAPSARLAARPAATRRKRRENVDETVADMLGSLGWEEVLANDTHVGRPIRGSLRRRSLEADDSGFCLNLDGVVSHGR